jgi:antitoxin ParD1/3/4
MAMKPVKTQTLNVALSPELARFVRERVEGGLYSSASEVVREALRLFSATNKGAPRGSEAAIAGHDLLGMQEARIDRARSRETIDELLRLRKGTTLGADVTVRDLIDEGRR